MRRSSVRNSFPFQWLLRGSVFVSLLHFASCSSEEAQPSPATGGPGMCLAPAQACNGACADFASDPTNCGSCGVACVAGQTCQVGTCKLTCVAPQIECSGQCAATASNSLHCGGCNQPCAAGQICQASTCVDGGCPEGQSLCNGACVDTLTDVLNCGACNAGCLVGQSCDAGACTALTCADGESPCNGVCTDVTTAENCGGCAQVCPADQTCQAGICAGGSTNGGLGGSSTTTSSTASTATTAGGGQGTTTSDGTTTTGGTGGTTTTTGNGGATTTTDGTTTTTGSGGTGGGEPTGECRVWLAANGNDSNDGSEASPVATLHAAYDLMCPVPPSGSPNGTECVGEAPRTICVKPGTYPTTERLEFRKTRMGSANNRLILQGDPNSQERPLLDFSSQERLTCGANPDNIGGLTINANYVTVRNIAVRGANDSCILVQGTEGLVENVLTYECADTGIQISSGGDYEGSGTNNTVRNCDSHSNYDVQCDGENADGFAIKEGTGAGNAFIGCRAWNNTDDGFDLYAWTSTVRIENSWAFDQCATTENSESDCNGFKLGGDGVSATHQLQDLIAVGNSRGTGNGFTENSNPASMTCSGTCAAWGNNVNVDSIGGVSTSAISGANVTNMASDNARNADGSLKAISAL